MFKEIQLSNLFSDSKTFVDSVPKISMAQIAARYHAQKNQSDFNLTEFVYAHFELPEQAAADFHSDTRKSVEEHIDQLWDLLTRAPDLAASKLAETEPGEKMAGTLIPLPNSYVVPGGRFREVYYWDSYFTMLGLEASGRWDLIEGMVNNFSYLIDTLGFIPNGNRTYYEGRSQPPFYALMVELLAQQKGEQTLLQYLPQLLKEYAFWMDGSDRLEATAPTHRRVVLMPNGSKLNRYWDDIAAPRPESFKEDYELVNAPGKHPDPHQDKLKLYRHIRAAAESGWDFSGRWFKNGSDMNAIHTTDIIPIDLNALVYNLEQVIAGAYTLAGDDLLAKTYHDLAELRKQALLDYCWDEQSGFFRDYDFVQQQQTSVLSLAAVYPLYFGMVDQHTADCIVEKIARDFVQAGGVTTTLNVTGQQWDAPNGWAPLQWITIQSLRRYHHYTTAEMIKSRWIALNKSVYQRTGKLVEKYNVYDLNVPGGGGEYELQDGFGWTNGVLLRLLTEDK